MLILNEICWLLAVLQLTEQVIKLTHPNGAHGMSKARMAFVGCIEDFNGMDTADVTI